MRERETGRFSEALYILPQITVIVRARNEAKNILTTLESLFSQTFKNFEVIVVDNGSCDGTGDLAKQFFDNHPEIHGRLVFEPEIGWGKALHTGVEQVNNEWIACLDGDSTASPTWLAHISSFIVKHPDYVAGSGSIIFRDGLPHHKFLYQAGRGAVYSFSSVTNRGWISLANSWFRKSIFLEIGGTKDLPSNVIVDDRILALRLRPHGKIAYLNGSAVRTSNWLTEKKKWVSGLLEELEQVKVLANIPQ